MIVKANNVVGKTTNNVSGNLENPQLATGCSKLEHAIPASSAF
jgi:hypothetical protein